MWFGNSRGRIWKLYWQWQRRITLSGIKYWYLVVYWDILAKFYGLVSFPDFFNQVHRFETHQPRLKRKSRKTRVRKGFINPLEHFPWQLNLSLMDLDNQTLTLLDISWPSEKRCGVPNLRVAVPTRSDHTSGSASRHWMARCCWRYQSDDTYL